MPRTIAPFAVKADNLRCSARLDCWPRPNHLPRYGHRCSKHVSLILDAGGWVGLGLVWRVYLRTAPRTATRPQAGTATISGSLSRSELNPAIVDSLRTDKVIARANLCEAIFKNGVLSQPIDPC